MLKFLLFCAVFLLFQDQIQPAPASSPRRLELYYEALCPYSREFVLKQLIPAYHALGAEFQLELIPFGNVQVSRTQDLNPVFKCQHGEAECYSNRVQACAVDLLADSDDQLTLIECMFGPGYTDPYALAPKCFESQFLHEAEEIWRDVHDCVRQPDQLNNSSSPFLLAWARTRALTPKLGYVPWIVIDGQHSEAIQEQAGQDLVKTLCDFWQLDSGKVSGCSKEGELVADH